MIDLKSVAFLAMAVAAPQVATATVINVDVTTPTGTSVALAAGTYNISFAGIAGGGTNDAFSYWTNTAGCDVGGGNCARGWVNHFAIDLGNAGVFDRTVGTGYGLATIGGIRKVFDTPGRALLEYSTTPLQSATLAAIANDRNYFLNGGNAYTTLAGPISFTLASAQSVNFFVIDQPHNDNRGGVSLLLAAVPEPATWAMFILGFGVIGATMRRRSNVRTRVSFV